MSALGLALGLPFSRPSGGAVPGVLDGLGLDSLGTWSMARRMISTYTGPLIRVRADRTGQPEQDIGFLANNELDLAALTTFANGDPCYVVKIYTQNGGGSDWEQTGDASKQPLFTATGINSLPALLSDGSNDDMTVTFGAEAEWWAFIVFRPQTVSNTNKEIWALADYPTEANYRLFETIGDTISMNNSSGSYNAGETLTTTDPYAYFITGTATAGTMQSSNGPFGSTGNNNECSGMMRLCGRGDPGLFANINVSEILYGQGVLSPEQEDALFQIANAKWGTALP